MGYSYKAVIRKDGLRQDGTVTIYLRVILNRKPLSIPLDIQVPPQFFNESEGQVLSKYPNAQDYNLLIQDAYSRAHKIIVNFRLADRELTRDLFKNEFLNPQARLKFVPFYEKTLLERYRSEEITKQTWKNQKVTLKKLQEFDPEVRFSQIDVGFLEKFDRWHVKQLKSVRGHYLVDGGKSQRANALKDIRTYLNAAIRQGIKVDNPFKKYRLPKPKPQKICLTRQEVKTLHEYYLQETTPGRHKKVLKAFLFSCYASPRYGDLKRMQFEWIIQNNLIILPEKTKKTSEVLEIPLPGVARDLIGTGTGLIFNLAENQKCNEFLKEIQKITGIEKRLTMHVGRHTFATLFLESGGAVEVLQKLMGHSSIKTTMVYVHLSAQRKQQQMNRFDSFLGA